MGAFGAAIRSFEQAMQAQPDDELAERFIEWAVKYQQQPADEWEGVMVMDSK